MRPETSRDLPALPETSPESDLLTSDNPTAGMQLQTSATWLAHAVELLSSMRFAISLLCIIAITAVIGTVLKQNEAMPNYVNQFGPFWFEVFQYLGLYSLYSAWWFLLIMGFLVLSTSLCLIRNAPKMLKDMRSWREHVREQSLRNFHHRFEWQRPQTQDQLTQEVLARLKNLGYQSKLVDKEGAQLISAKRGAGNKWGYIFAHTAIVVICVGGLLDSDLSIRMQVWFDGKLPYQGGGIAIAQIPEQHKLSLSNPTFRGSIAIPEGMSGSTVVIQQPKGVLLQELPFTIQLNQFKVDYYSTGMPKLFSSEVEIKDHETGKSFPATVQVNHPLIYKGIAVFQSSFDDGGSQMRLKAHVMQGAKQETRELNATVGGASALPEDLSFGRGETSIEWTGFRALNVENMARNGQDVRAVNADKNFTQQLSADLDKHTGAAAKNANKDLKNVGPSIQYKLRDKTGQAREFSNYMMPLELDGMSVFLAGARDNPNEAFRYLRMPADESGKLDEWMRLRAALAQPELRARAAEQYAKRALPATAAASMQEQLSASARKGLAIFAGEGDTPKIAGFAAIAGFLENIPAAEQGKAADVFMKILNGSLWDLWQLARVKDGLPVLELNEKRAQFLQVATSALSDAFFYGAPVYMELDDFDEVKASVFQVTRAPGQSVVYIGCLLLVLGVFAMFYIRERRVWVWVKPHGEGTHALLAFSSQRKTLDFEREFEQLKQVMAGDALMQASGNEV